MMEGRSQLNFYNEIVKEELNKIKQLVGEENFNNGKYELAAKLFNQLSTDKNFSEFLTLSAYKNI